MFVIAFLDLKDVLILFFAALGLTHLCVQELYELSFDFGYLLIFLNFLLQNFDQFLDYYLLVEIEVGIFLIRELLIL